MPIDKTQTLAPGTTLVGRYKKMEFTATVREDGIYVEPAPLTPATAEDPHGPFRTLSAAGKAVMGGISCNGWRFWSPAGAGGNGAPTRKAPAVKPTRVTQIRKLPNQKGVEEGQAKYFCSACMASFLVVGADKPDACPQGHPREAVDDFAAPE